MIIIIIGIILISVGASDLANNSVECPSGCTNINCRGEDGLIYDCTCPTHCADYIFTPSAGSIAEVVIGNLMLWIGIGVSCCLRRHYYRSHGQTIIIQQVPPNIMNQQNPYLSNNNNNPSFVHHNQNLSPTSSNQSLNTDQNHQYNFQSVGGQSNMSIVPQVNNQPNVILTADQFNHYQSLMKQRPVPTPPQRNNLTINSGMMEPYDLMKTQTNVANNPS
jgi:hypothetical protein